ncbi:hypothetical protein VOLCADRAFT_91886 [Volvox carteri f. nagariensis]|uniref:Uncharacterized protein n=1 Tax=Volvox carteri f. nagariensis TaxID=3068 RepID=D8TY77_VOLCA|nr:uncharacterized protein VOLCADRAFT_91886 [Volvox carteri f. nagariensis]EFJ47597.1 hypothetical protein VOLCADRAFT_91886 [Volvox carteri f. nagariensis]|eukprot:XP_002951421.1 hypothetical protein VOLCADRAFT_91886 [Volvox carteri f. nagariensis]
MLKSTQCVWVTPEGSIIGSSKIYGNLQGRLTKENVRSGTPAVGSVFRKAAYYFHKDLWTIVYNEEKRKARCLRAESNTWRLFPTSQELPYCESLQLDRSEDLEEDGSEEWGDFVSASSPFNNHDWATGSFTTFREADNTSTCPCFRTPTTPIASTSRRSETWSPLLNTGASPTTSPTGSLKSITPLSSHGFLAEPRDGNDSSFLTTSPTASTGVRLTIDASIRQQRLQEDFTRAALRTAQTPRRIRNADDVPVCAITISSGANQAVCYVRSLLANMHGRVGPQQHQQQHQATGQQEYQGQPQQHKHQRREQPQPASSSAVGCRLSAAAAGQNPGTTTAGTAMATPFSAATSRALSTCLSELVPPNHDYPHFPHHHRPQPANLQRYNGRRLALREASDIPAVEAASWYASGPAGGGGGGGGPSPPSPLMPVSGPRRPAATATGLLQEARRSPSLRRFPWEAREMEGDKTQEGATLDDVRRENRRVVLQASLSGPGVWC